MSDSAEHSLRPSNGRLPDFLVIGAQKGGTSAMYRYLIAHHNIQGASRKEVHFFDANYAKGLDWYRSFFGQQTAASGREPVLTFEATPEYLFIPYVPARVARDLQDAKFIATLRNPIDRAYSQYQMSVRKGVEPLSFEDAIEAEEARLDGERQNWQSDSDADGKAESLFWHAYAARGRYYEQIVRWEKYFSSDRFLILSAEQLRADTAAQVGRIFDFLGLPRQRVNFNRLYNVREYEALDPKVRKRLAAYFEPHNQELYRHLGVDFGWK